MLKRIGQLVGKQFSLKKEVVTPFFSFNDVQFIIEDEKHIPYYLVISLEKNNYDGFLCKDEFDGLTVFLFNFHRRKRIVETINQKEVIIKKLNSDSEGIDFSLIMYDKLFPTCESLLISYGNEKLPFYIENNTAYLGTWNNFIKKSTFFIVVDYIFNKFPLVNTIEYKNLLFSPLVFEKNWRHPDFYIPLNCSSQDLFSRLSKKPRQRTKRERAIIAEAFGSCELINIPFANVTKEMEDFYYKFAFERYGITKEKYDIYNCFLSDVYILKAGSKIAAIDFTCEQGKVAYWECGSFDTSNQSFSFGKVLYGMALEKMADKGLSGISIGSIPLDYKKHYGSIEFISNSGKISRKNLCMIKLLINKKFNFSKIRLRFIIWRFLFRH